VLVQMLQHEQHMQQMDSEEAWLDWILPGEF
jgi:hypothetical protein